MTYISPIEIVEKISNQIEKDIMEVVLSYGIKIDKDELVKALLYDRKQYEKGYADGQRVRERTAKVRDIVHTHGYPDEGLCGNCNEDVNDLYDYCPNCGAKLDWSE